MRNGAKQFILKQMTLMADNRLDPETFGNSKSFEGILSNHECMMTYPDEASPEALDYWQQRGLTKEIHEGATGVPSDKWASYLPNEIADGTANDKKYPLLFVLHGAGNPIYLAESYGYTRIAAREKLIVIIPEDETPDKLDALFRYAHEHYPVDWSRVYMVGYSLGGYMTSRHAFRWPDRLAAVGIGGMLFANGHAVAQQQNGKVWEGEDITQEDVLRASQYGIPACISMGEYEVLGLIPVTQDEPENPWVKHLDEEEKKRTGGKAASAPERSDRIDLSAKNKIASINNFRIANGCAPIDEAEVFHSVRNTADIVIEKIGFPFEHTFVETRAERSYLIGDSVASDSQIPLRMIGVSKAPHWITQEQAELTWEFISQFSVDSATGKSYKR